MLEQSLRIFLRSSKAAAVSLSFVAFVACADAAPPTPTTAPSQPASSSVQLSRDDILRGLLIDFREGYLDGISVPVVRRAAATGDISFAPVLIELTNFAFRVEEIDALEQALHSLTGEEIAGDDYFGWYAWLGRNRDVEPPEGYAEWKGMLYSGFDTRFQAYFPRGFRTEIPLAAVQWGGVRQDGIPPLENPLFLPAQETGYLEPGELVFGVFVNGEARAYPLRIMNAHELANDVVGGSPVSLAYCTLCRSGVLWDPVVEGETTTFGTSGFLYQSNKLMYDRRTGTLWEALTGRPVIGALAGRHERLEMLPLTLTSWEEWLDAHPESLVLALDQGFNRRYAHPDEPNAIYHDYFNSPDLMFPAFEVRPGPAPKERIFGLTAGDASRAYRIEDVAALRVINDALGDLNVVITGDGDPNAGAARAYDRGSYVFKAGDAPRTLLDEAGRTWFVNEDLLLPPDGSGLDPLERLPAHEAFWFGWTSFHPETTLYAPGA